MVTSSINTVDLVPLTTTRCLLCLIDDHELLLSLFILMMKQNFGLICPKHLVPELINTLHTYLTAAHSWSWGGLYRMGGYFCIDHHFCSHLILVVHHALSLSLLCRVEFGCAGAGRGIQMQLMLILQSSFFSSSDCYVPREWRIVPILNLLLTFLELLQLLNTTASPCSADGLRSARLLSFVCLFVGPSLLLADSFWIVNTDPPQRAPLFRPPPWCFV